jgi:hypothetical protein
MSCGPVIRIFDEREDIRGLRAQDRRPTAAWCKYQAVWSPPIRSTPRRRRTNRRGVPRTSSFYHS